jgi:serine/threonine protein phosphatase PrpC
MQCENCHAEVPDDDVFCEACGQRLSNANCPHKADEDGFCELCGLRVVLSPEDHEEVTLSPDCAGVTDRGVRRSRNEDRLAIRTLADAHILVVCDGVSTSHESQLASAAATAAASDFLVESIESNSDSDPEELLQSAIATAARTVAALGPGDPEGNASSTTIVVALARNGLATVGWAGDSRAYWIAGGAARQLTTDHSWVNQVVAKGEMSLEEAEHSPTAHAITRWLGADAPADEACSVVRLPLVEPGVLLLCTDGLWNYSPHVDQIGPLVVQLQNGTGDMLKLTRGLVEFAKRKGGSDNVTAAALRVREGTPLVVTPRPEIEPEGNEDVLETPESNDGE